MKPHKGRHVTPSCTDNDRDHGYRRYGGTDPAGILTNRTKAGRGIAPSNRSTDSANVGGKPKLGSPAPGDQLGGPRSASQVTSRITGLSTSDCCPGRRVGIHAHHCRDKFRKDFSWRISVFAPASAGAKSVYRRLTCSVDFSLKFAPRANFFMSEKFARTFRPQMRTSRVHCSPLHVLLAIRPW